MAKPSKVHIGTWPQNVRGARITSSRPVRSHDTGRVEKGWVVMRFDSYSDADPAEKLAETWLQLHDGNFKLKAMTAGHGCLYIAGILI